MLHTHPFTVKLLSSERQAGEVREPSKQGDALSDIGGAMDTIVLSHCCFKVSKSYFHVIQLVATTPRPK
jgi:hypothetical protein